MKHVFVFLLVCAFGVLSMQAQETRDGVPKHDASRGIEQVAAATPVMPNKVSYQGVITYVTSTGKTKAVKKGTYSVKFGLYDAKTVGTLQDEHTYNVVVDKYGVYTVTLGEDGTDQGNLIVPPKLLWLQVTVLSGPETKITYPYALTPRAQFTSVPYALGPWQQTTDGLSYSSGNVGIGTTSPQNALHVKGGVQIENPSFTSYGFVWYNDVPGSYSSMILKSVNYGTNTTFTDDIVVADRNGNVGIGTSAPASKLDVAGDITVSGNVNYASPKTGYISAAAWALGRALNDPGTLVFSWPSGIYSASGDVYEVPLNLPNGVTLTSVDVYGYDADGTRELLYNVVKSTLDYSSVTTIGAAGSGGPFSGGNFTATVSGLSEVIDNSANFYWIELLFPPTSNVGYKSFRATFTYSSPGAISTPIAQPVAKPVASPQTLRGQIPSGGSVRLTTTGGR